MAQEVQNFLAHLSHVHGGSMNRLLASIAVVATLIIGCGSEEPSAPTFPVRIVSERLNSQDQLTQADVDLMQAEPATDWTEPVTTGRIWFGSTFELNSGDHTIGLAELVNNQTSEIKNDNLAVRADGEQGDATPLCMSPDGKYHLTLESDDEVPEHPVGNFFDCYNPRLRVRSRK